MFRKTPTSRTANVLLATLIVLVGVGSMLALSSDRLMGTRKLQSLNLATQQATYAAEAVASLVETKLVQSSGDLTNLTKDVIDKGTPSNPSIAQRWLQQGLYDSGKLTTAGMWIGNCLVYWRIEPVKIYSETITDTNGDGVLDAKDTLGTQYSDNYQANPNEKIVPTTTWSGTSLDGINPGYYHFRIVTQAYYVNQAEWGKNNVNVKTADPWTRPEQTIASAQTQRMVQLKLINLFRYVIFYGASGATGDIELNPGADLDIVGAVHTNGAMYLGGQGNKYLSGDYHDSASSGAHIYIGTTSKVVTVTGVDGIFRTRKVGNYYYQQNVQGATPPSYQFPYNIPPTHILSGNDATSNLVQLNGKNFTFANDSRMALVTHSDYVRDRKNRNAAMVNTLANIPQLSGYPFEHQMVVGQGQPLFQDGATGFYTVRPNDFAPTAAQLYYRNPLGNDYTIVTANTGFPVYATDMPMVTYNRGGNIVNDVLQVQPTVAAGVNPVAAGLYGNPAAPTQNDTYLLHPAVQTTIQASGCEARGYYLQQSLFGLSGSGLTGLTIRERGAQNTSWPMLDPVGVPIVGIAARPVRAAYPSDATWLAAFAGYMARNYVVYMGLENNAPADITAAFFGFAGTPLAPTYTTQGQFPAWETGFMNRREANSYVRMRYLTAAAAVNYQVDVLTLSIARIQALISSTTWIQLCPTTTRDPALRTNALFNGMIYAHRTPRLGVTAGGTPIYDPAMPLAYHPLVTPAQFAVNGAANPIYQFNGPAPYPIIGSVSTGNVNLAPNAPDRDGDPVNNVWSVFPSQKQVRVINGATINWGQVQSSGRLQGLTVVTPNHCYIQGDYNTTPDPKPTADGKVQYPPCGIYADGMTMLTNLWVDTAPTLNSSPNGDNTTYNVSLVMNNIPTDYENSWDEGSGGTHNLLRFLEGGGREFRFLGSIVVLNRMRYGRNYLGASAGYYGAPKRILNFNDDLLTAEGQPPFSPWGIQVTRVLSSVNIVNH